MSKTLQTWSGKHKRQTLIVTNADIAETFSNVTKACLNITGAGVSLSLTQQCFSSSPDPTKRNVLNFEKILLFQKQAQVHP